MLLSLLQSPNRVELGAEAPTDAFVPIVKACATSRVWKVRRVLRSLSYLSADSCIVRRFETLQETLSLA